MLKFTESCRTVKKSSISRHNFFQSLQYELFLHLKQCFKKVFVFCLHLLSMAEICYKLTSNDFFFHMCICVLVNNKYISKILAFNNLSLNICVWWNIKTCVFQNKDIYDYDMDLGRKCLKTYGIHFLSPPSPPHLFNMWYLSFKLYSRYIYFFLYVHIICDLFVVKLSFHFVSVSLI